jgi:6-phosphogluconolactonase (cycloisomerase 2 family)
LYEIPQTIPEQTHDSDHNRSRVEVCPAQIALERRLLRAATYFVRFLIRPTVMKRIWFIVLSALAISFSFLATPLWAQFAYVTENNDVRGYSINRETGALTPVPGSPFPTGSIPDQVAVDQAARFVYVTNALFRDNLSGFSIDPKTGTLTAVPDSPFPTGSAPQPVAVDQTGQFVYVGNLGDNNVSGYRIDRQTGSLKRILGSPFATGVSPAFPGGGVFPESIAVDQTAQFVYVAVGISGGGGTVVGYRVDRDTGALTPVPGSPFKTGDGLTSVVVDPKVEFAYVATSFDNRVWGYRIDRRTGALTPVPGSPFTTGTKPSSIAVDQLAQFVYVTNETANTVSGFSIDRKTGSLTPVPGSPFPTESVPKSVAVDQTAQFVYVVSQGSNHILGYRIDPKTGTLREVPSSPFATGSSPKSIAITRH